MKPIFTKAKGIQFNIECLLKYLASFNPELKTWIVYLTDVLLQYN